MLPTEVDRALERLFPAPAARRRSTAVDVLAARPKASLVAALLAERPPGGVWITGTKRGEGRSTLTIALARWLAEGGGSVALLDADPATADLARRARLRPGRDWAIDVEAGRRPEPIGGGDRMVIYPLIDRRHALGISAGAWGRFRAELAEQGRLVLIDGGPVDRDGQADPRPFEGIGAAIVAHRADDLDLYTLARLRRRLDKAGVRVLARVATFGDGSE